MLKGQPIMKPISFYYSSRNNPMPDDTATWIEELSLPQRMALATGLLTQCNYVFVQASQPVTTRPTIEEDHAS